MISRKRNNDLHQIWSKTLTYTAWQAGAPSLSTQLRATITIIQLPLSPTGRQAHQHSEKALASNAATNSRCNRNTINYHPKTTTTTTKATALAARHRHQIPVLRVFVSSDRSSTREVFVITEDDDHNDGDFVYEPLEFRLVQLDIFAASYYAFSPQTLWRRRLLPQGLLLLFLAVFTGQFNQIKISKNNRAFFAKEGIFSLQPSESNTREITYSHS